MTSRTFSIIKPDAVGAGVAGKILEQVEADGFRVLAMRMTFLSRYDVERFYAVHRGKPFFEKLCWFMSSGPIVALVLECQEGDAVGRFRALIGATDPVQAAPGTIRKQFAASKTRNAIHASDSFQNAMQEAAFFFTDDQIFDTAYRLPMPEHEIDGE